MAAHNTPDAKGPRGEKGLLADARPGIFARFTLRSLAANRVRTIVTVVGIALATGLLVAVFSSVTSLQAGLLRNARQASGIWQAEVYDTTEEDIASVRATLGDHFDRLARRRDLGAAALSAEDSERLQAYLGVLSLPVEEPGTPRRGDGDEYPVLNDPEVREGRLPERPGEIALPLSLRGLDPGEGASAVPGVSSGVSASGPLEVGSTVELSLGRRWGLDWPSGGEKPLGVKELVQTRSSFVSSTEEYEALGDAQDDITETVRDVDAPRAFTVVGFVTNPGLSLPTAFVSPEEPAASCGDLLSAWFSTTGYTDETQLMSDVSVGLGHEADTVRYGYDGFWINAMLLMQQGLDGGQAIFETLMLYAIVLSAVIMTAAVSLISNAFTISLSERTRQFGLLSSLGASRRQIRRTVLVEAGVLGVCGIPLGVGLGLLGAWVAFRLTSDGWAAMVGTDSVTLSVEPWVIAASVGLAALTLLLSALFPALRASRVSAVDAIRQAQDVRPNRRLAASFRRMRGAMGGLAADGTRPRGLAARVAGMPGFLARRTLKVSASKSRVAVVSLAVSVTLLVTAGVLGDFLGSLGMVVDYYPSADVEVGVSSTDRAGLKSEDFVTRAEELLPQVQGVEHVRDARFVLTQYAPVVKLDPSLVDEPAQQATEEAGYAAGIDQRGYAQSRLLLVDDATWRQLAGELGLSEDVADPGNLGAVLLNARDITSQTHYGTVRPFHADKALGSTVDVLSGGRDGNWYPTWDGTEGELVAMHLSEDEGTPTTTQPIETMYEGSVALSVDGVTEELPDWFPLGLRSAAQNAPTLIAPRTAVMATSLAADVVEASSWVEYFATVDADASSEEALEDIFDVVEQTGTWQTSTYSDLRSELREARAVSFTMQVFLYCFAGITAAIAVANVFNTIASGMMLRTREFATLRSAGMGERAFRRMIFFECSDLAVRGFAIGLVLSLLVDFLLWDATTRSMAMEFPVPWGHLALAFAVVTAVLAASVAYALRKTHALNLVEALRADAL